MFAAERAPLYVKETGFAAARLQEHTTPAQYAALVEKAERLLTEMFTVDVNLDHDLMVKIALRERFVATRVKQAILMVATWQLVTNLASAWTGRKKPAPVRQPILEPVPA